jgi:hypothetical protein
MAYWLGDSDSAHTVDRVLQETLANQTPFQQDLCSTIVPKCLADNPSELTSFERRLNPWVDDDAVVPTRNKITWS